jgi:hypothetical protein
LYSTRPISLSLNIGRSWVGRRLRCISCQDSKCSREYLPSIYWVEEINPLNHYISFHDSVHHAIISVITPTFIHLFHPFLYPILLIRCQTYKKKNWSCGTPLVYSRLGKLRSGIEYYFLYFFSFLNRKIAT